MGDEHPSSPHSILLGRPFMKTSNTIIDVKKGIISIECDELKIQLNIHDPPPPPVKSPEAKTPPTATVHDPIDSTGGSVLKFTNRQLLEIVLNRDIKDGEALELTEKLKLEEGWMNEDVVLARDKKRGAVHEVVMMLKEKFCGRRNAPKPP